MAASPFQIRFWGVRGSLPVAELDTLRVGGNTSCVEVRCGERVLLLDAGSGVMQAGRALASEGIREFDLFLSHSHYDHIIGLPFFEPVFIEGARMTIWSGHLWGKMSTDDMVNQFMRPPYFPIGPGACCANLAYHDFRAGDVLDVHPGIAIRTTSLNHPGGAVGYRIDQAGRSLAYLTDTEHKPGTIDQQLADFIVNCDLVIYDCTFIEEEMPRYEGFGHSSWQQGVKLCMAANAKRFAIFHHALYRTDDELDAIEADAKAVFPGAFVAREGTTLEL
jgi:phosphoribosyl 1,2-cyclic phosphodiesterase